MRGSGLVRLTNSSEDLEQYASAVTNKSFRFVRFVEKRFSLLKETKYNPSDL